VAIGFVLGDVEAPVVFRKAIFWPLARQCR
jgi:hypothetical protein